MNWQCLCYWLCRIPNQLVSSANQVIMNAYSINRTPRLFQVLTAVFILFSITSCARKALFVQSAVVPAATGKVKVKKDGNDNYRVSVNVENLPPANELTPARAIYVMWMESSNGTKNIGQLKTSTGLFSKTYKGALETTSPYRPYRVFITAEDIPDVQYPGGQTIISTNSF